MLLFNRKVAWFAAIFFLVAVAQDEEEPAEGGEEETTAAAVPSPAPPPTVPAPTAGAPNGGVPPPNGGVPPPNGGVTPPNGVPPPNGGVTPPNGVPPPNGGVTPPNGAGPTPIPVPPVNPPPPNGGGLPPTEPPKVGTPVKPPPGPPRPTAKPTPRPRDKKTIDRMIKVAVFKESVTPDGDEPILQISVPDEPEKFIEDSGSVCGNIEYSFDVWLVLMQTLNLSVQFVFPDGMKQEPSSLKSLVLDGKADMIFSSIPLLYANTSKEVEYTSPIDAEKVQLFIKTPTSETSFSSLGNVFRPLLWITIGVAMALMAATLICIEHMGYNAKMGTYLLAPADTGQLIITILGNFCYQGAIEIASGCAGRVVIFSSLMCGYLVYISYSTLVISQLTAVKLKLPFESIEELAKRKDYKLMVKNDVGLLADIEVSRKKKGALADVWNSLLPAVLGPDVVYSSDVVGLRSLCQENIAILTFEQRVTTQLINKTKCSATPLRQTYFRSPKGYAMRPNFEYSDLIKRTLTRMREVGILNRWRRYWDAAYGLNQEADKAATTMKPITLDTMLPLLGIVLAGMVASIVILAFEITYKKLENAHKNRRKEKQFKMFHSKTPMPFVN